MHDMKRPNRRETLACGAAASLLSVMPSLADDAKASGNDQPHIATNMYPWLTFARRNQEAFEPHSDQLLGRIAETGIAGYEPIINSADEVAGLAPLLRKHSLQMDSIYVNSVLHDAPRVQGSTEKVMRIAEKAKELGTKIIVTNPSPIRWGGNEDKSDAQLRLQARSLDTLGAALRKLDITLAYHNHDAELRQGGREFHHMLTATDQENVKFCLDAHWIYRGCGNSELAVFDALHHYQARIVELHLRQSENGVWTEAFSMTGDIDYTRLLRYLTEHSITPHLVLEQAVEEASPRELTAVDAHRASRTNLHEAVG